MERLLVVWCPELLEEHEHGREARANAAVAETLRQFSPGVDVVRPGVCALVTRGPARYFGGDETLAGLVLGAASQVENPAGGMGMRAQVGVADGLVAAYLAARDVPDTPRVVAPGASPDFLAPWPVTVLDRPELADLLSRLGIHSLGAFAALPTRHVLARFGTDGALCHQVAAGTRGELPGLRQRAPGDTAPKEGAGAQSQPGFWGGTTAVEARARRALTKVVELIGPEAVLRGRLQGGRGPSDRARLVPWGKPAATGDDKPGRLGVGPGWGGPPWPGRVPPPAPVIVARRAVPVILVDGGGTGVGVTPGGRASAPPVRLSIDGGQWAEVSQWAGPWPADERWWSTGPRRLARMQVVTADGAHLLAREQGCWWVEGTYD